MANQILSTLYLKMLDDQSINDPFSRRRKRAEDQRSYARYGVAGS